MCFFYVLCVFVRFCFRIPPPSQDLLKNAHLPIAKHIIFKGKWRVIQKHHKTSVQAPLKNTAFCNCHVSIKHNNNNNNNILRRSTLKKESEQQYTNTNVIKHILNNYTQNVNSRCPTLVFLRGTKGGEQQQREIKETNKNKHTWLSTSLQK